MKSNLKAKVKITEVATNKVPLNLDGEWYKGGGRSGQFSQIEADHICLGDGFPLAPYVCYCISAMHCSRHCTAVYST